MITSNNIRVLCIDDDVHVLSVLSQTLVAAGYNVDTALDGSHALQKIATTEQPYDVLVVDERMPNVAGWRLIVEARAAGYKGKVIVFSAYLDEAQRTRFQKVNVDAVVDKPMRPTELVEIIEKVVG